MIVIKHFHFYSEILVSFFDAIYIDPVFRRCVINFVTTSVWLFLGCSANAARETGLLVHTSWLPRFFFVFSFCLFFCSFWGFCLLVCLFACFSSSFYTPNDSKLGNDVFKGKQKHWVITLSQEGRPEMFLVVVGESKYLLYLAGDSKSGF